MATFSERLDYNPATGIFTWRQRPPSEFSTDCAAKTWNTRFAHRVAGSRMMGRYRNICIDYCLIQAHRLAWFYVHDEWPDQIDHINGDKDDNRIVNLRSVPNAENRKNQVRRKDNKSGYQGVCWVRGKWRASIQVNGKSIHLGRYSEITDALAARAAAEQLYGFHPNHGRAAWASS
jgi:hypothetical protein